MIVGVDGVENYRNMRFDVDGLKGSWGMGRRRWRRSAFVAVKQNSEGSNRGRRGGTAMTELLEVEQRVDLHGVGNMESNRAY